MKKIPKLKKISTSKDAAVQIPVNINAVRDRHATNIPNLRSVLRNMIAGVDLAEKYNEPVPVLPSSIEIKQTVINMQPWMQNNCQ